VASLDVRDSEKSETLASRDVMARDMAGENRWTLTVIEFDITNGERKVEFRVFWCGQFDLDVACVRLRKVGGQ